MSRKEKEIVAYHETGHALMASLLQSTDPVHKISIIPRGIAALGYTMQRPTEDRYLMTKRGASRQSWPCFSAAGSQKRSLSVRSPRAAHDDLAKATDIAKSMVKEFGMSERVGHVTYEKERKSMFLDINPESSPEGLQRGDGARDRQRDQADRGERVRHGAETLSDKKPLLEEMADDPPRRRRSSMGRS